MNLSGVIGFGVQFGRALMECRSDHGLADLDKASRRSEAKTTHFLPFCLASASAAGDPAQMKSGPEIV